MISTDMTVGLKKCLGDLLLDNGQSVPKSIDLNDIISTDSRSIQKDNWYLPLVGEKFDGHDFIAPAIKNGAKGFFYSNNFDIESLQGSSVVAIKVLDTLKAYQKIAYQRKLTMGVRICGLSGSVGKTTVKEMVSAVFRGHDEFYATPKNFNNQIGVPKCLLEMPSKCQRGLLEFGARHLGDLKELISISSPDISVLLNIGNSHIGEFGSQQILTNTKLEMFSDVSQDCHLIYNEDDPRMVNLVDGLENTRKTSFGTKKTATVRLEECTWNSDGSQTVVLFFSDKLHKIHFARGHYAYGINSAAAFSIAVAFGVQPPQIVEGLAAYVEPSGRFRQFDAPRLDNVTVIDDCYNANPASMQAGLVSFEKRFSGKSQVIIVGDMLELGDESLIAHQQMGSSIAQAFSGQTAYFIGEMSELASKECAKISTKNMQIKWFSSVEELLKTTDLATFKNTNVFIKASNGTGLSALVTELEKI
jgi:UDP-N-acetylmuramoyl-tripeptide--D-alanyl-D-alanine ligase